MRILIIDDDRNTRLALALLLKRAGYEPVQASSPAEALGLMRADSFALVLMDMNYSISTSGEEGLRLLQETAVLQPGVPVILMTAWGSIELAVRGMRLGAFDFVTKPWSNPDILGRIRTALRFSGKDDAADDREEKTAFDRCGIIGRDPRLEELLHTVERVAPTDAPVLILGENGTGKELIARAIHANSRRSAAPFVTVNLGGISRSLFESEMFGYAKGAFTGADVARQGRFEVADKGTIFLDEIGDLDLGSQVKLLRVLQQHTFEPLGQSRPKKVDIRVVCATNADIPAMVKERTFREDLYYRINLVTLRLPSLRERPGDIPLLANHFLRSGAADMGVDVPELSSEAMERLVKYDFPGNIRQLRNVVERAIITCAGGVVGVADLDLPDSTGEGGGFGVTASSSLGDIERMAVVTALKECGGNLSRAALRLGISRQALYRRMAKYGLQ